MLISMVDSHMSKLLAFRTEPDPVEVMEKVADVLRDVLRAHD